MDIELFKKHFKGPERQSKHPNDDGIISAGICDNCKHPKPTKTGDGINEPPDFILFCHKMSREICPELPKDRIVICEFYSEI